jgi:hypothetical protein
MISGRRRSITAGGDGEGTPNSSAERTTTILRRRSGGRRATTHRQGLELQRSINQGQPLGQNYNISGVANFFLICFFIRKKQFIIITIHINGHSKDLKEKHI